MQVRSLSLALALGAALTAAPALAKKPDTWSPSKNQTEYHDSSVAVSWMELLYDVVKAEGVAPPPAGRLYGAASVALYESVVGGSKYNRSLSGQLNDLVIATPKPGKLHWPSAANAAMATALRGLFPAASPASSAAIDALEAALAAEYQSEVPPGVYDASVAHGIAVAEEVVAWLATDGFSTYNNCAYAPPVGPGLWEPTPPGFAPPLQPCWGDIRTFAMIDSSECAAPAPPEYSTDQTSELFMLAQEVVDVKANLTPEQDTIARYWADGPVATGTPAGHWIAIVSQISEDDGLNLMDSAEAFARVGISVADAFFSCWRGKYDHNLLRPVTYIQDFIDPAWLPLLGTPPFPEHTSGHSTQSGASSTVLADMFGVKAFTDTTHTDHGLMPPQVPRTFSSFEEAAAEAAVSRLYGGIHYRSGNDGGLVQGQCIGNTIAERVRFKNGRSK